MKTSREGQHKNEAFPFLLLAINQEGLFLLARDATHTALLALERYCNLAVRASATCAAS